jgi:glutamyl-tRNA synthetase
MSKHPHSEAAAADSPITRLAPSPTGTLHLGNARTFLVNWALARNRGWKICLRIEDLDITRVRPGAAEEALDLLRWLGIDWDENPFTQSHDLEPYRAAMHTLARQNLVYASALTRKQVEHAASAPHAGESETRFPADLRPDMRNDPDTFRFERMDTNYRFIVAEGHVEVADEFAGHHMFEPARECGDFIVWTRQGVPAYQLAVVVDDTRQGVTDVVRGDDLLPSAARQTLIYRALGTRSPRWWHLPLVLGDDGRRLAKRHGGGTHLQAFRQAGTSPERVVGLLAAWCGVADRSTPTPMSAHDFRQRFDIDMLPRSPVHFTTDDLTWLNGD